MLTKRLYLAILIAGAASQQACIATTVEGDESGECDDGVDNNQNGLTDCSDPGCAAAVACDPSGDDDDGVEPPRWVALSAATHFHCGLSSSGEIACWGNSDTSDGIDRLAAPPGPWDGLDAALGHTCARSDKRPTACWGAGDSVEAIPPVSPLDKLDSGIWVDCGLDAEGAMHCWGDVPDEYTLEAGPFVEVAAGNDNVCTLDSEGTIECRYWGSGGWVNNPPEGQFLRLAVDENGACAIAEDGEIGCWGQNSYGEADAPSGEYVEVSISTGSACALGTDGSVTCWGCDFDWDAGQCDPPDLTDAVSVRTGRFSTCALRETGTIVCWGSDAYGQLNPPPAP